MTENQAMFWSVFLVSTWLAGIAIAQGFWMTLFAVLPPVGWYLVIERIIDVVGLI